MDLSKLNNSSDIQGFNFFPSIKTGINRYNDNSTAELRRSVDVSRINQPTRNSAAITTQMSNEPSKDQIGKKALMNEKSFITGIDDGKDDFVSLKNKKLKRATLHQSVDLKDIISTKPGRLRQLHNLANLEDTTLENEMIDTMAKGGKKLRNLMANMSLDTTGWRYHTAQKRNMDVIIDQCSEIRRKKE